MLTVEVSGSGPRLVLVHGFTQTRRSWEVVAPRFAEHHEVVAVDAPGHGGSRDVVADLWESGRLVGEVGGEADYVGYSMGGRVVLHLALSQPALVRRLVLVGATAGIDDAAERAARRDADEALAASIERDGVDAFLERWLSNPLFATLPPHAAGRESRRENTAAGLASSLRHTGTGTQEPLWDRLATLTAPVLFVVGAHDEKFTALAGRMQAAWGGPAQVVRIDGAGHAAHLERPEEFVDVVERFLHETAHQSARPSASSAP